MKNILTLLTTEDKEEIRQAVKEMIITQIRNDLENNDCYIIDPGEIEDMLSDVVEEAKDEIRPILKEKLYKEMEEKLGL